jgi:hypothetical protein
MGDSQPGFASACSCVVAVTRCQQGAAHGFAYSYHSSRCADEPAADRLGALYPDWSEHIVTIVAASLAVLVVALMAVVMGMA